jgi:hypothetical protein
MGIFDLFKNKKTPAISAPAPIQHEHLPTSDPERSMVERITIDDMRCFTSSPYRWDEDIKTFIKAGGHPFAYMNLSAYNTNAAKSEIQCVNRMLAELHQYSRSIPSNLSIPTAQLVFIESHDRGHTRLICTPFTPTGKNAKYPFYLFFMTNHSDEKNSSHGELHYLPNGNIGKATIYLWRNKKGYFIYYKTVQGVLTLSKIDYVGPTDLALRTIYKLDTKK